jgi:hypothetical protein
MDKKTSLWKYLFQVEVIFFIIIMVCFIYFAYKAKKRKYPFFQDTFSSEDIISYDNKVCFKPVAPKKKKSCVSRGEFLTGEILKEIFPYKKFKKIRPNWLRNIATGHNLEIDFYCDDIKTPIGTGVGFEIDGAQHSIYNPFFHKTKHDFTYQLKKDQYKDKLCKNRGVVLIRIPYFITTVNLKDYIIKQLKIKGIF